MPAIVNKILSKARSGISNKCPGIKRWIAHSCSRYSNRKEYRIIDSYVHKYRALGGLTNSCQYYKLFRLKKLLEEEKPKSIIELGTGASTIVFAEFVRDSQDAHLTCVDESRCWLENSQKLAKIDSSDTRFCMITANRLFINNHDLKQIKYDMNFDKDFECVFIDGPNAEIDGVKHKDAVNTNIFDIAKRKLPRLIIVDIRQATVEELKKRLGEKYDVFVSDMITGRICREYRYFTVFRLKSQYHTNTYGVPDIDTSRIRIYFNENPRGFVNSFIKSLYSALQQTGQIEFAGNIEDDYEILFLDEFKTGVRSDSLGKNFSREFRKYMKVRTETAGRKKIVVRAINLKQNSRRYGFLYRLEDNRKIKLLNSADMVIFQSHFQKNFFVKYGYKCKNNTVIHNGADNVIFNDNGSVLWDGKEKLKIISCTMSGHSTKRHDLIAKVSLCRGVEVSHIGRWPDSEDKKNVKLLGIFGRENIADAFRSSHIFLHTAVKDPCPSVIFEAICCGLPVIYNDSIGSSKEIVQNNGLPINEGNPQETIEHVKKNYYELKENIKNSRDYYSIARVADQYIKVFSEVSSSNENVDPMCQ